MAKTHVGKPERKSREVMIDAEVLKRAVRELSPYAAMTPEVAAEVIAVPEVLPVDYSEVNLIGAQEAPIPMSRYQKKQPKHAAKVAAPVDTDVADPLPLADQLKEIYGIVDDVIDFGWVDEIVNPAIAKKDEAMILIGQADFLGKAYETECLTEVACAKQEQKWAVAQATIAINKLRLTAEDHNKRILKHGSDFDNALKIVEASPERAERFRWMEKNPEELAKYKQKVALAKNQHLFTTCKDAVEGYDVTMDKIDVADNEMALMVERYVTRIHSAEQVGIDILAKRTGLIADAQAILTAAGFEIVAASLTLKGAM